MYGPFLLHDEYMTSLDDRFDRRTVLRTSAALVAAGLLAGCSDDGSSDGNGGGNDDNDNGNGNGNEDYDFGGFFDGVDSYDGLVDETGSDAVTVTVGAEGNGGPYAYDPTAVKVDAGTTVTFEWVSDTHNVAVVDQPDDAGWEGHETIENEGFSFESTFETPGAYTYVCEPHESLGMKGAIVVE